LYKITHGPTTTTSGALKRPPGAAAGVISTAPKARKLFTDYQRNIEYVESWSDIERRRAVEDRPGGKGDNGTFADGSPRTCNNCNNPDHMMGQCPLLSPSERQLRKGKKPKSVIDAEQLKRDTKATADAQTHAAVMRSAGGKPQYPSYDAKSGGKPSKGASWYSGGYSKGKPQYPSYDAKSGGKSSGYDKGGKYGGGKGSGYGGYPKAAFNHMAPPSWEQWDPSSWWGPGAQSYGPSWEDHHAALQSAQDRVVQHHQLQMDYTQGQHDAFYGPTIDTPPGMGIPPGMGDTPPATGEDSKVLALSPQTPVPKQSLFRRG